MDCDNIELVAFCNHQTHATGAFYFKEGDELIDFKAEIKNGSWILANKPTGVKTNFHITTYLL